MLEVKGLYFKHRSQKTWILENISFSANPKELTVILGANGSGKTTIFKCITGLWKPQRGEVFVNHSPVSRLSFSERAKYFSVVPQEHHPPFEYTVKDVVLMGRACYLGLFTSPTKEDFKKVEEALKFLNIYHLKDTPYTKISGGERQLVLIARALCQSAPVLILDEPTSHLDFKNQVCVLTKIKDIAFKKRLVVITSLHDPNLALLFANKVVLVKAGKVVKEGTPQEVITPKSMEEVYGIKVEIISQGNKRLIYPCV